MRKVGSEFVSRKAGALFLTVISLFLFILSFQPCVVALPSYARVCLQVRIKHAGCMKYMGVFADQAEAAQQWDLAALRLRGPVSTSKHAAPSSVLVVFRSVKYVTT